MPIRIGVGFKSSCKVLFAFQSFYWYLAFLSIALFRFALASQTLTSELAAAGLALMVSCSVKSAFGLSSSLIRIYLAGIKHC